MDKLWLALAAWVAGIAVAALGWLDSKEKFDLRKFFASVIRSLFAGGLLSGSDISKIQEKALDFAIKHPEILVKLATML